jgi:hypothetical protein
MVPVLDSMIPAGSVWRWDFSWCALDRRPFEPFIAPPVIRFFIGGEGISEAVFFPHRPPFGELALPGLGGIGFRMAGGGSDGVGDPIFLAGNGERRCEEISGGRAQRSGDPPNRRWERMRVVFSLDEKGNPPIIRSA